MRLRDHDQPCEHSELSSHWDSDNMGRVVDSSWCPGGREVVIDSAAFPVTFAGFWRDGDETDQQVLEQHPDGWETFEVWVRGVEAGDMRELLPDDLPALFAALGLEKEPA